MVSSDSFRSAWGMYPTGVALVTTVESDGSIHGMPANGINSVSIDPFLVLLCVDHQRETYGIIRDTGRFGINILAEDQKFIVDRYLSDKKGSTEETLKLFSFTEHGSAILENCLAMLDCRVTTQHLTGDHTIFIAEVDGVYLNHGEPLIFFKGEYRKISHGIIHN